MQPFVRWFRSLHRHPARPAASRKELSAAMLAGLSLALACSDTGEADKGSGSGSCAPQLECAGECTDTSSSLLHCGACYDSCTTGQDCVGGICTCILPLSQCGAACVNTASDPLNCGICGNVCGAGLFCSNGTCTTSCAVGQEQCGQGCVDVQGDPTHCGTCDKVCEAGQGCSAGLCECTQGRVDCGQGCVDRQQDPLNCGTCGTMCGVGQQCVSGVCQGATGTGGVAGTGGATGGTGGVVATGGVGTGGVLATGGVSTGGAGTGGVGTGGAGNGCNKTGFYVANGTLYDKNCNEFIMRGVNYPYAWYTTDTNTRFANIAAADANVVRVVLATGDRWTKTSGATLTQLIGWAKANKLIMIAEVHDMTGWAEQSGSVDMTKATAYWTSAEIKNALVGQEAYVIINIANEPMGNDKTAEWVTRHTTAVAALRSAGLTHTLMVDAPNWGQDWSNTMRDGTGPQTIFDADSQKNVVFSVHMYDVYGSSSAVTSYFSNFLSKHPALPLVIGEFAADHGSSGNVDEDTIMAQAEMQGVGYMGWSWSGNGGGLETLDITNNFNAGSLTTWGNRLINGTNGIKATADVCTVFN